MIAGRLRRAERFELEAIAAELHFDPRAMTERDREIVAAVWQDRVKCGRPATNPKRNRLHVFGTGRVD
jgi:hypothetical protein